MFAINDPHVIAENIEGDTIILNFDSGSYYSLNAWGSIAWDGYCAGLGTEELVSAMAPAAGVDAATVARDLETFAAQLTGEQLLVEAHGNAATDSYTFDAPECAYEAPAATVFNDLQELLLLDPIHDVDSGDWPR